MTSLSLFTFMHWRRKWQPTPVFLPGESQGRGSLVGCRPWGRTESDTTERLSSSSSSSSSIPLCVCAGSSLSSHLSMDYSAVVNSAAMNIKVCLSFQVTVFSSYTPSCGIAGSCDSSMFHFFGKEPPSCFLQWLCQFTFLPTA